MFTPLDVKTRKKEKKKKKKKKREGGGVERERIKLTAVLNTVSR